MKIFRTLILSLFLAATLQVAVAENYGGLFNIDGRKWAAFPQTSKDIYLHGVLDGLSLVKYKITDKHTLASTLTASEYREAIDTFYKDPKNRWMPLIISLTVVSMEAQGKPRKEIEEFIEDIREIPTKTNQ